MQPKIVKGKPKPIETTASVATSFLSSVGTTAGSTAYSVLTYLSGTTNNTVPTTEEKKDYVTFTKFEDVELVEGQDPTPCLLVGYQSGFQIWDLSQSEKVLARNVKKTDLKITELMCVLSLLLI